MSGEIAAVFILGVILAVSLTMNVVLLLALARVGSVLRDLEARAEVNRGTTG